MSDWATTYRSCVGCTAYFLPSRWSVKRCPECLATCSVDGCDRLPKTAGFCPAHYWRNAKRGEPGSEYIRPARGDHSRRAGRHPAVAFTCKGCGRGFTAPPSIAFAKDGTLKRKYCTKACMVASRDPKPTFKCAHCGLVRLRPKPRSTQAYAYRQKFCSRACQYEAQAVGATTDKHGYRHVRVNGARAPEHRVVMAKKIGRELFADETVHHKDGDRQNNDPSNLELWSSRHGKGQRVDDKIEFCQSFLSDYGLPVPMMDPSLLLAGIMGCV